MMHDDAWHWGTPAHWYAGDRDVPDDAKLHSVIDV
jgi:hypothetical protein